MSLAGSQGNGTALLVACFMWCIDFDVLVLFLSFSLSVCLRCLVARRDGESRRDLFAMSFAVILQLLILVFELLLALRLDGHSAMPWRVVFVPLFILTVFALVSCIFSCVNERSVEVSQCKCFEAHALLVNRTRLCFFIPALSHC